MKVILKKTSQPEIKVADEDSIVNKDSKKAAKEDGEKEQSDKDDQSLYIERKTSDTNPKFQEEVQNKPDEKCKFSCPECSNKYDYQADLWSHIKSDHNDPINLPGTNHEMQLIIPLIAEQNAIINAQISGLDKNNW